MNHAGDDAPEPVRLLEEAARRAASDTGAPGLMRSLGSVRVVNILSWRYRNPAALIAERLGRAGCHTVYSTPGGNAPQLLVSRAARDIQAGDADTVLVGGAESWRTRMAYRARGERPSWTRQSDDAPTPEPAGSELVMVSVAEEQLGIRYPTQAYPLLENALRAKSGRPLDAHRDHIAGLWSRFSDVATGNPYAAVPRAHTAEEIAAPGPANRMVGLPYTKLMNANNAVNQAAALLLTSVERARAAGVPPERLVFLHGAAEADDVAHLSHRVDLASSPAIRFAGQAALGLAGVDIDEVDHLDLYSCFPSAVQIAATELGIDLQRRLTVTGGLTFAGGPWNNYVTHAIASMVATLRADPGSIGLCTANGGLLTKHAVGVYSTRPPRRPFAVVRCQADVDRLPRRGLAEDA
ncbi:MAG: acetyl-CoA acetyltransferase, partial [Candidatus Dormibacteria bacterium]